MTTKEELLKCAKSWSVEDSTIILDDCVSSVSNLPAQLVVMEWDAGSDAFDVAKREDIQAGLDHDSRLIKMSASSLCACYSLRSSIEKPARKATPQDLMEQDLMEIRL